MDRHRGAKRSMSMPINSNSIINIHMMLSNNHPPLSRQYSLDSTASSNVSRISVEDMHVPLSRKSSTVSTGSHTSRITVGADPPSSPTSVAVGRPPPPKYPPTMVRVGKSPPSSPPSSPTSVSVGTPSSPLHRRSFITDILDSSSLQDSFQDSALGSLQEDNRSVGSNNATGSDESWNTGLSENSSLFNFLEEKEEKDPVCTRVAVICTRDAAVMVKICCRTEHAGNNSQLQVMLTDLAKACAVYFRKENREISRLNTIQLNKMPLSDGRPAREHVVDISRRLSESITLCEASSRRQPPMGFVGTMVVDTLKTEGNLTIATSGVLVVLRKKNRYTPDKEFSDQLCEHIIMRKPTMLGSAEMGLGKKEDIVADPSVLMAQTFLFDTTVTVAEAARRSFIIVSDYVLYE